MKKAIEKQEATYSQTDAEMLADGGGAPETATGKLGIVITPTSERSVNDMGAPPTWLLEAVAEAEQLAAHNADNANTLTMTDGGKAPA